MDYRKKKIKDPGWIPDLGCWNPEGWSLDWDFGDDYLDKHSWGTSYS
jgi:hypothetical protein